MLGIHNVCCNIAHVICHYNSAEKYLLYSVRVINTAAYVLTESCSIAQHP